MSCSFGLLFQLAFSKYFPCIIDVIYTPIVQNSFYINIEWCYYQKVIEGENYGKLTNLMSFLHYKV